MQRSGPRRTSGFSLLEVLISTSVVVIGLIAVLGAVTTTALVGKKCTQEDMVFQGISSRMEWVRSELFANTPFNANVQAALAVSDEYVQSFPLDHDGDGVQDLSFVAGDQLTPIIQVTVSAPSPPANPSALLSVSITANWYGTGGNRTRTLTSLVANRSGYGG